MGERSGKYNSCYCKFCSVSVSKSTAKIHTKLFISIYSAYKSAVVSVTLFPSVRELTCENDLKVITLNSPLSGTCIFPLLSLSLLILRLFLRSLSVYFVAIHS